jgi:hypothetical protein
MSTMTLDTHLHNLIAQWFAAEGNLPEQHRLQHEGMTHLQKRASHMSQRQVARTWEILIDALGIYDEG